jgi:hypothetical protein
MRHVVKIWGKVLVLSQLKSISVGNIVGGYFVKIITLSGGQINSPCGNRKEVEEYINEAVHIINGTSSYQGDEL